MEETYLRKAWTAEVRFEPESDALRATRRRPKSRRQLKKKNFLSSTSTPRTGGRQAPRARRPIRAETVVYHLQCAFGLRWNKGGSATEKGRWRNSLEKPQRPLFFVPSRRTSTAKVLIQRLTRFPTLQNPPHTPTAHELRGAHGEELQVEVSVADF